MTVSGYTGAERFLVKNMISILGANYTGYFTQAHSHLVCKKLVFCCISPSFISSSFAKEHFVVMVFCIIILFVLGLRDGNTKKHWNGVSVLLTQNGLAICCKVIIIYL